MLNLLIFSCKIFLVLVFFSSLTVLSWILYQYQSIVSEGLTSIILYIFGVTQQCHRVIALVPHLLAITKYLTEATEGRQALFCLTILEDTANHGGEGIVSKVSYEAENNACGVFLLFCIENLSHGMLPPIWGGVIPP